MKSLPTSTCFIVLIKWRLWMWPYKTHPCGDRHLLILDGPVCVWTWNVLAWGRPGIQPGLHLRRRGYATGGLHPQPCCACRVVPRGTECKEQRDRRDEGWMCPATRREARLILIVVFMAVQGAFCHAGSREPACLGHSNILKNHPVK